MIVENIVEISVFMIDLLSLWKLRVQGLMLVVFFYMCRTILLVRNDID